LICARMPQVPSLVATTVRLALQARSLEPTRPDRLTVLNGYVHGPVDGAFAPNPKSRKQQALGGTACRQDLHGQATDVTVGECRDTVGNDPLGCFGPRQSGCAWEVGVTQDGDAYHAFCALVGRLATTADISSLTSGASIPAQARGATHGWTGTRGPAVARQQSARGRQRNAAQTTAKPAR
jgi:hypothetical protein